MVLDAELHVLLHGGQEHTFKTISVPKSPDGAICTVLYALQHCWVPAQRNAMIKIVLFEQGRHEGRVQPKMSRYAKVTIPLYHWSDPEGKM